MHSFKYRGNVYLKKKLKLALPPKWRRFIPPPPGLEYPVSLRIARA
jgi:hypothetical protein